MLGDGKLHFRPVTDSRLDVLQYASFSVRDTKHVTAGAQNCGLLTYFPSNPLFCFRPSANRLFLPRAIKVDGSPSVGSPLAESPTRGGARSGVSPVSRLRPPSAGRRRRSSPSSPVSAPRPRDRDKATPYSTSPPLQRRRIHSPAQGKISRVRYDGGASPDRVGQRGQPGTIGPRGMGGREISAKIPDGQEEGTLVSGGGSHELARLKTVRVRGVCVFGVVEL